MTTTSPAFTLPLRIPSESLFFGIEHARPALEAQALLACNFCNRALGREISVQDHQVAVFLDRIAQGPHDRLTVRICADAAKILGQRRAGYREAIAVQQAGIQQGFHQRLDAADRDQLRHRIPAAGPQIRQHGHALADSREIVDFQFDTGGGRDRQ